MFSSYWSVFFLYIWSVGESAHSFTLRLNIFFHLSKLGHRIFNREGTMQKRYLFILSVGFYYSAYSMEQEVKTLDAEGELLRYEQAIDAIKYRDEREKAAVTEQTEKRRAEVDQKFLATYTSFLTAHFKKKMEKDSNKATEDLKAVTKKIDDINARYESQQSSIQREAASYAPVYSDWPDKMQDCGRRQRQATHEQAVSIAAVLKDYAREKQAEVAFDLAGIVKLQSQCPLYDW
jgi:hypothetical protein